MTGELAGSLSYPAGFSKGKRDAVRRPAFTALPKAKAIFSSVRRATRTCDFSPECILDVNVCMSVEWNFLVIFLLRFCVKKQNGSMSF